MSVAVRRRAELRLLLPARRRRPKGRQQVVSDSRRRGSVFTGGYVVVKVDGSHKGWLIFLVVATAGGGAIYALSAPPNGPWGNTWTGLTFGVLALLMMLFAGALGLRKKFLLLRVGRVDTWTKGHLWVGALSLPFVLYHGAFQWGGPLTAMLLILLILVVLSGILGAALQHTLPTLMMFDLPNEATYEHIERSLVDLRCEAYEHVWAACGEPPDKEEARQIAKWRHRDMNRYPVPRRVPPPVSAETEAEGKESAAAKSPQNDLGPKPIMESFCAQILLFIVCLTRRMNVNCTRF